MTGALPGWSLAEQSGMGTWKAWAHVTVDEENIPEVLWSVEVKHQRSELFVEQKPRAVRWVEADEEHHVEEDENQASGPLAGTTASCKGSTSQIHLLEKHAGVPEVQFVPPRRRSPVWQCTGCFVHHRLRLCDWVTEGWLLIQNRVVAAVECSCKSCPHARTQARSYLTKQVFMVTSREEIGSLILE